MRSYRLEDDVSKWGWGVETGGNLREEGVQKGLRGLGMDGGREAGASD